MSGKCWGKPFLFTIVLQSITVASLLAQDSLLTKHPLPFPSRFEDALLATEATPLCHVAAADSGVNQSETRNVQWQSVSTDDNPSVPFTDWSASRQYCKRMSDLLSHTLPSDSQSESYQPLRQTAIEAAMLMVAETIEAQSQAQIAELRAQHAIELARLQTTTKKNSRNSTIENGNHDLGAAERREIKSPHEKWLAEIQANQAHNLQQMKTILANHTVIARSLDQLDNPRGENGFPVTHANFEQESQKINPQPLHPLPLAINQSELPIPHTLRTFDGNQSNSLADQLRHEIRELHRRLDKIQSESVRANESLKPVYTPDHSLQPIR